MTKTEDTTRTAGEAGWHASRYNLSAQLPGTDRTVVVNLLRGTCIELSPLEAYLLSVVEELDEDHPIIASFERQGLICAFDERAALDSMGRIYSAEPHGIGLVICPTMSCNFRCPYCFEDRVSGTMSQQVQDDIVALAGRLFDMSGARAIQVNWFGGEPLLAPDIIESLSGRLIALAKERGATNASGYRTA